MLPTTEYQRASATLESHGVFASGTLGRSMRPLFREGKDIVIVYKNDSPPKKYDVILYGRGEKCVLHRVIGRKGTINLVRGDNTYVIEKIPDSAVLGVLMEFDRGKKHHTVNECGYKMYSIFWNFIYPLRYACVQLKTMIAKVYKRIFLSK